MRTKDIIEELVTLTLNNKMEAERLKKLPAELLNRRKHDNSWSALECIEHLCRYGQFYIPEIQRALDDSSIGSCEVFRPGLLGDFFAKRMLPKQQSKKMKTFKSMNPIHAAFNKDVLAIFITQQNKILELLAIAANANLTKIMTAVSISKWIKLRLGDTLRVLVYHNYRHILQAKRTQT